MKKNFINLSKVINLTLRITSGFLLLIIIISCATVPGLKEEQLETIIRIPFVRVLLEDKQPQVVVMAKSSFAIECLEGGKQLVFYSSQPVKIRNEDMKLSVINKNDDIIREGLDEVNIIPRGQNNRLKVNNRMYRGLMKALPYGQNVHLINIVYMEDYLRGVVPPEIGNRTDEELEAVKAQAVAARTYSMAHLKQYGEEPYDMKSSIIDQVYGGMEVENRLVNKAVDQTAGIVVKYQDGFIDAYYHSTCGGMTDDIAEVWDKKELPYLKPVTDSSVCAWSKYYKWEEVYTEEQLRSRIELYLSTERGRPLKIEPITSMTIDTRTAGGRVSKLSVHTKNDIYRFYKDRIRWVLLRSSNADLILPSDLFNIEQKYNTNGDLVKVVLKGNGYGHGVGMCQCGAIGLARKGKSFDVILKHYYSGIDVKKLY